MTYRSRRVLFTPLLLLVIYIGFFWKLLLTDQYTWLEGPDYANQVLPWYQMQAREWHQGRFPLWDPYVWGGQPLLAQAQPGAAYPPNWLLFLLPLKDGFMQRPFLHWYFVLIHFAGGLFCYLLCRDLKRSSAASLLAGVAFGLGGYVGTTDWPQMLNGAIWAPLILMFFLRSMRGERPTGNAAMSGALLGVSLLSGHHQIPTFVGLTMLALWIYHLRLDRHRWKHLVVFSCFAVLVGAFQLLPAYEYGNLALRWVGAANPVSWKERVPYYVHEQYSFPPESIFGIVIPGMARHSDPYLGMTAFVLALLSFAGAWRERYVRLFGAIALGGLLFSLGRNSVFHGFLYSIVPMVEKARNPSMASFIFHLGLCVLVAYGIDSAMSVSRASMRRVIIAVTGFSGALLLLILVLDGSKIPFDARLGMVGPAGLALAILLAAWHRKRNSHAAAALLLMLMLLELGNVTTYGYQAKGQGKSLLNELSQHNDIAAFLRAQPEPARVEMNEAEVAYNFGDWHGIEHFGGYLASMTNNVSRMQGSLAARALYGVKYFVGRAPIRPDQVEVFTSVSGLKVYRNPRAMPRTWIVHRARSVARDDRILPIVESADFNASEETVLKSQTPELETCSENETAALTQMEPSRLRLTATLHCRGMVIIADTYFPGWQAFVDGVPAEIQEAYGCLQGIVVDGGQHRIELIYRPRSVYWGASLTAIGLLGAIAVQLAKT